MYFIVYNKYPGAVSPQEQLQFLNTIVYVLLSFFQKLKTASYDTMKLRESSLLDLLRIEQYILCHEEFLYSSTWRKAFIGAQKQLNICFSSVFALSRNDETALP